LERERYSAQWPLHRQLTGTVHAIWQKWARAAREDESAFTEAAKWEKEWLRLNNCHAEWVTGSYRDFDGERLKTPC